MNLSSSSGGQSTRLSSLNARTCAHSITNTYLKRKFLGEKIPRSVVSEEKIRECLCDSANCSSRHCDKCPRAAKRGLSDLTLASEPLVLCGWASVTEWSKWQHGDQETERCPLLPPLLLLCSPGLQPGRRHAPIFLLGLLGNTFRHTPGDAFY